MPQKFLRLDGEVFRTDAVREDTQNQNDQLGMIKVTQDDYLSDSITDGLSSHRAGQSAQSFLEITKYGTIPRGQRINAIG